jgi:hypothetical protein
VRRHRLVPITAILLVAASLLSPKADAATTPLTTTVVPTTNAVLASSVQPRSAVPDRVLPSVGTSATVRVLLISLVLVLTGLWLTRRDT